MLTTTSNVNNNIQCQQHHEIVTFDLLRLDVLFILHQRSLLLHARACLRCLQHSDFFLVSVAVVTLCQSHITHATASLFELQLLLLHQLHRRLLVALQFALKRVVPTSRVTRHTSYVTRHTSHVTRYTSHVTRHELHMHSVLHLLELFFSF